jgi:hypothetical protein
MLLRGGVALGNSEDLKKSLLTARVTSLGEFSPLDRLLSMAKI